MKFICRNCNWIQFLDTRVSLAPTPISLSIIRNTFGFSFCQRPWDLSFGSLLLSSSLSNNLIFKFFLCFPHDLSGLVEFGCVGASRDPPPSPLWLQLPNSWPAQLWPLEEGKPIFIMIIFFVLSLQPCLLPVLFGWPSITQQFAAYHACPDKVKIQHGQIYSSIKTIVIKSW